MTVGLPSPSPLTRVLLVAASLLLPGTTTGCSLVVDRKLDSPNNNHGPDAGGPAILSYQNEKGEENPQVVLSAEQLIVCVDGFGDQVAVDLEPSGQEVMELGTVSVAQTPCFLVRMPTTLPAVETALAVRDPADAQIRDSVTFTLGRYLVAGLSDPGLELFLLFETAGQTPHGHGDILFDAERHAESVVVHPNGRWAYVASPHRIYGDQIDLMVVHLATGIPSFAGERVHSLRAAAAHPSEPELYVPCKPNGQLPYELCRFDYSALPGANTLTVEPCGQPLAMPAFLAVSPNGQVLAASGSSQLGAGQVWVADDLDNISLVQVSTDCSGGPDVRLEEPGKPVFPGDDSAHFVVGGIDMAAQGVVHIVEVAGRCAARTLTTTGKPLWPVLNPAKDLAAMQSTLESIHDASDFVVVDMRPGLAGADLLEFALDFAHADGIGLQTRATWVSDDRLLVWTTSEASLQPSTVWLVDLSGGEAQVLWAEQQTVRIYEARIDSAAPTVVYVATESDLRVCTVTDQNPWIWGDCPVLWTSPVVTMAVQP